MRKLYEVTIQFDGQGAFVGRARSQTRAGAFNMVLMDARMAHTNGSYNGKVLGWDAVEVVV